MAVLPPMALKYTDQSVFANRCGTRKYGYVRSGTDEYGAIRKVNPCKRRKREFVCACKRAGKRAHHFSIRVTGPTAKTRSLIRRKRRVKVEGFAATRYANGRWHSSHPTAVNRGRPRRCCPSISRGRQPTCPLLRSSGKK